MPNVYVEPCPKGRPEGTPIDFYVLETQSGNLTHVNYKTQREAINAARALGYQNPLVARVRNTNKGNPDHWRSAD